MTDIYGRDTSSVYEILTTGEVVSLDGTAQINLGNGLVEISATLDMKENDIINVGSAGLNLAAVDTKNNALTEQIAPRGISDDWTTITLTNHSETVYAEDMDILLFCGGSIGIDYSTDGGLTQIACTFDVAPTTSLLPAYESGVGFVALIPGAIGGYTSGDGISWVATGQAVFGLLGKITYFNGLWIAGTNVVGFRIATSPDGITWTLRTATIQVSPLVAGPDRVVSNGMYSLDGMTWVNSTDLITAVTIIYNPDKLLYVSMIYAATGEVYTSTNGDNWTTHSSGYGLWVNVLLYSTKFKQYYVPWQVTGNIWTISATSDPVLYPFKNRLIPNATVQGGGKYSLLYLEPHDRFIMMSNASGPFNYSTNNENLTAYKGLTTSTINGLSPTGGVYMTTSNGNIITATAAETSLFTGSTGIGNLTVPANGFTLSGYHMNTSGDFSSFAADTITIRFKSNGVEISSIVSTLTGSNNKSFEIEVDFCIRVLGGAGVAQVSTNFDFTYAGSSTTNWRGDREVTVNSTTFSTLVSNTLDVTIQFSSVDAANSIQLLQAILTKVY